MSSSQALYYIGPPGPARQACLEAEGEVRVFSSLAEFSEIQGKGPGLVVVAGDALAGLYDLAADLWDAGPGWALAVANGDEPPVFRTVSVGVPGDAGALSEHLRGAVGAKTALVDLREALLQIGRTRHDVNNPLTAALAEIQILLMDVEEGGEEHQSLLVVQEQLRRIRDLVAATGHLRLPR